MLRVLSQHTSIIAPNHTANHFLDGSRCDVGYDAGSRTLPLQIKPLWSRSYCFFPSSFQDCQNMALCHHSTWTILAVCISTPSAKRRNLPS
jgi:hypothetical protein